MLRLFENFLPCYTHITAIYENAFAWEKSVRRTFRHQIQILVWQLVTLKHRTQNTLWCIPLFVSVGVRWKSLARDLPISPVPLSMPHMHSFLCLSIHRKAHSIHAMTHSRFFNAPFHVFSFRAWVCVYVWLWLPRATLWHRLIYTKYTLRK